MNGTACPCFADAKSMTAELKAMGVECMLSPYLQFAVQQVFVHYWNRFVLETMKFGL